MTPTHRTQGATQIRIPKDLHDELTKIRDKGTTWKKTRARGTGFHLAPGQSTELVRLAEVIALILDEVESYNIELAPESPRETGPRRSVEVPKDLRKRLGALRLADDQAAWHPLRRAIDAWNLEFGWAGPRRPRRP